MQQIAKWLASLGLGQYTQRFDENGIDVSVLRHLTDADLTALGVLLGHRRKMLAAIADLSGAVPSATPLPPSTEPKPQDAAERRQLTVMFVDLVGSTALSARLDPEDMREIVGAYHRSCAEQITKAGGFVAKYMGDGVLAYFGYPQAHEHDAERAVVAGLALAEAVPKLSTMAGSPLQVRIGIATGLVVVGDLIGMGAAQEQAVVGGTPNLAARLQALAEPNMVVIADSTRRLLGNLFELKDLGPRDLKGIVGPVRAWAAVRASSAEGRFEALHTSGLTALVGREEELELLLRRWSRTKRGEGQVVLLSGEAGIGKSRLTAALLERLADEPHTRLRYFCSPQHTDSALYPIIGQMERAAGLAYDDKPQAKLDKLDAVLAQTSTSTQDAALFAEMLTLANDGRYPAVELAPEHRRQRTLEALTLQLAGLARQQPVLMIFEDAHWVDPTSLEVLGRTVDRIKTLPALLIVTFRSEFNAPWVGQSHVTSLTLNRLGEREAAAIIARLAGNKALPADVLAEIVGRTDGIPLFVEEMTKAVLEAESEGAARRTVAAVPSPASAVPASLARLADGAARPARPRQGGGADRVGDRAGVLPCAAGFGRAQARGGAGIGSRASHSGRFAVPAGRPTAGELPVQACPGAGRGLWHFAARAETRASRPDHRSHRKSVCGDRGNPAGAAGASLHGGWADREGRGPMGQGGTTVARALGAGRSRGPAHSRPRADRDLARHAGPASRADQASGRAYQPPHACQRLCRRGNQGGCGAGPLADRAS